MKRIFLLLVTMAMTAVAYSQVASWLIPPIYDNIFKVIGANLVVTDSVG